MNFWIIHAQEPLPDPSHVLTRRLWRSNTIAEMLAARGHRVVRWRSGYSHYEKRYLVSGSPRVQFENYECQYLEGPPYGRNIGPGRVLHHRAIARDFSRLSKSMDHTPDLIHVANVPIELCRAAVSFACEKSIPVVIDVRDLWPDIFLDIVPEKFRALKPVLKFLLRPSYANAAYAMSNASAVTGITDPFVEWALRLGNRQRREADRVFHMSYPEPSQPADKERLRKLVEKLGLEDGEFIICYFGNIGYQSDFDTLIESAKLMRAERAKLVICGSGPKLQSLRQRAADLPNVVLPGWLEAGEIRDLMQISSVGLLPFKDRDNYVLNMPNKFSEYLSGGLVVACGVRGEMANMIETHQCGFVYPTGDASALAQGLKELMMSPHRVEAMKQSAKALFDKHFNCRVVYSELCEYLESMALTRGS